MQPLGLGAIICNISVSVGEKVIQLTDSYDVPPPNFPISPHTHTHIPHPPPTHLLQTTFKTRLEATAILYESI